MKELLSKEGFKLNSTDSEFKKNKFNIFSKNDSNIVYENYDFSNIDLNNSTKAIKLRHIGCDYYDYIIIDGPMKGSVWCERFTSDGPLHKINDSFFEYVYLLD